MVDVTRLDSDLANRDDLEANILFYLIEAAQRGDSSQWQLLVRVFPCYMGYGDLWYSMLAVYVCCCLLLLLVVVCQILFINRMY